VNESSRPKQSQTITFKDQVALCLQNAEWIVEDYSDLDGSRPFANFTTVTFVGALAEMVNSTKVGPAGAMIAEMEQNGKVLTSTTITHGGKNVAVTYL
jgi:hypothetical protein